MEKALSALECARHPAPGDRCGGHRSDVRRCPAGLHGWRRPPTWRCFTAGLEPAAAGEVVVALERAGAAYEVRGAAIFVDAAQRDSLRLTLAAEGLPAAGRAGLRTARCAVGVRHHVADVRRRLLAREGGRAGAHDRRSPPYRGGARAYRQPEPAPLRAG